MLRILSIMTTCWPCRSLSTVARWWREYTTYVSMTTYPSVARKGVHLKNHKRRGHERSSLYVKRLRIDSKSTEASRLNPKCWRRENTLIILISLCVHNNLTPISPLPKFRCYKMLYLILIQIQVYFRCALIPPDTAFMRHPIIIPWWKNKYHMRVNDLVGMCKDVTKKRILQVS